MTDTKLLEFRERIDKIDSQIAELLDSRMAVTDEVAIYKNAKNLSITDRTRDLQVIENVRQKIKHPILRELVDTIYMPIIDANKTARIFNRQKDLPFKKIGIIGLGLIGGSIVKALKAKNPDTFIATVKRDSENNQKAVTHGYVNHEYETIEELEKNVEVIILATAIDAIIPLSEKIAKAQVTYKLIVIDIASVKTEITTKFEKLTTENTEFIANHPMAGGNKTSFEYAVPTLFINKPWVICPHSKNTQESLEKISQLISYVGSKPVNLDSETHDKYTALISHLIFIISTYLMAYPYEVNPKALEIAGSGFASLTRLASGSVEMHEQILKHNEINIEKELKQFIEFIEKNPITTENAHDFFEKYRIARRDLLDKQSL